MSEPRRTSWEEPLLERLAPVLAYPSTPDLAAAVRGRLAPAPARSPRPGRGFAGRAALAAAVLLVAFGLAVLLSGRTREAVANFFGLGVAGERIEALPTLAPGVTPTPLPTPPHLDDIASRITPEQAAARLGFAIATPADAGEPTAVYTLNAPADTVVILRYPGFDLWEFATDQGIFLKKQFAGSTITDTTVNGAAAYWIAGGTRLLSFVDASGNEIVGTQRGTTDSALLWSRNGKYYRIEGVGDMEAARRIAETVQ